jgi:tetratricopeptide (TPR) repeat protein
LGLCRSDQAIILVRSVEKNEEVIARYAITPDNMYDRLKHLQDADDFAGQVAAADLYSYAGRVSPARYTYEKIVARWPHMGRVWYTLGRLELERGDQANSDPALALIAIKNAIKVGYKTAPTYSYLALAYYRIGLLDEAEKAVRRQLRIEPDSVDGQAWVEILKRTRQERGLND